MKTRVSSLILLTLTGLLTLASAVPPPPPKPDPKPGPGPVVRERFCGVERHHRPHDWRGKSGKLWHCPGK